MPNSRSALSTLSVRGVVGEWYFFLAAILFTAIPFAVLGSGWHVLLAFTCGAIAAKWLIIGLAGAMEVPEDAQ